MGHLLIPASRCFLCQVPVSIAALVIGYYVIENPSPSETGIDREPSWRQIDLSGAVLPVLGLSAQLAAMSLGGNQYPWSDIKVIACFVISVIILAGFVCVELKTKALPVMPMQMLKGRTAISNMVTNVLVGMSSYAVSLAQI